MNVQLIYNHPPIHATTGVTFSKGKGIETVCGKILDVDRLQKTEGVVTCPLCLRAMKHNIKEVA